jgi:hypothetical protein
MATIDECIEFALKNIGLWWRYGISRHCDESKYIIIGRMFESEIILRFADWCRKTQGQYRNVPVPVAAYNLKSNVFCRKAFTEMNRLWNYTEELSVILAIKSLHFLYV